MNPEIQAFLSLIAWSEGTADGLDGGFGVIVSGIDGPNTFTDYSTHPFANGRPPIVVNHAGLESTASGRYQQRLRNWQVYSVQLNLPDFGHDSQDKMAVQLMSECNAVTLVLQGNIEGAIAACSSRWASFPGNSYGQAGGKTMPALLAKYQGLLN